jgi:hypothetical protein
MVGDSKTRAIRLTVLLSVAPLFGAAAADRATAAVVGDRVLLAVLGSSGAHLIGPARVGSAYGTLTSGFRSAAHNRRVGGVPNSYHLTGRAIDVERRPGVTHQMVDAALRRAGFLLVESLDEGDHSHFAFASTVPILAARTPVIASAPALAPGKPLPSRVLADEHGELLANSSELAIATTTGGI